MIRFFCALLWKRKKLAVVLQKCGPSFVKFGQILSMRPDLVGHEIAEQLTVLQDRMNPVKYCYIKQTIQSEFGVDLKMLFLFFDPVPVASASVAQVHFAITHTGMPVAVKILRPRIEKIFSRNIRYFRVLVFLTSWWPGLKRLRLPEIINTFEQWIKTETDLRLEAASSDKLRESFSGRVDFFVPRVFWSLTRTRILTMERVNGVHLLSGNYTLDRNFLLKIAIDVFLLQVFRDGFFHADMHPGNIFVTEDGLAVVDFGIMGYLNIEQRIFLAETLVGFLERDYARVARVHFEMGFVPSSERPELFELALRAIGEPMMNKPLADISIARLLADLFKTTVQFHMPTQPELLLLQKTLLMAEGLSRLLDPHANIWILIKPYITKWLAKHTTPIRLCRMVKDICSVAKNFHEVTPHSWRPRRDSNTQPTD